MFLCIVLLATVSYASADSRYLISAPNVFHIGVDERVSVTLYGIASPKTVQVYLQDYPHRRRIFSSVQAVFNQDEPQFLTVKVNPDDIPDVASLDKQFVYLVAKSDDMKFKKETKILLSYRDGVVLIQTDKPIYTPKQSVKIRVIPLGFDLMPTVNKISLIVKNPQDIRVQQWRDLDTTTGFISQVLDLGEFVLNGNWTVEASYGHQVIHNTSTKFEVREYVLPTFSVEVNGPSCILRTDEKFHISVTSKYTYQKAVDGVVTLRVKIVGLKQDPILINSFRLRHRNGASSFTVTRKSIMDLPGNIWFPEGCRLQVEADVMESSTGITEHAVKSSIYFTSTPYRIKFVKTAKYFKPGLQFPIKVIVTTPDNLPVQHINVRISAKGNNRAGKIANVGQAALRNKDDAANKGQTGADGQAEFMIDVPRDVFTLNIKVETVDPKIIEEQNGVKEYIAHAYTSNSKNFLLVRQLKQAEVGSNVFCEAFLNGVAIDKLFYMVVARGEIVYQDVIKEKLGIVKTIIFQATQMMSPSARLVAYYITKSGEVIADSTLLDVEDVLPNKVSIMHHDTGSEDLPGVGYSIQVLGKKGTRVGILGVDQSVYLLRNDNRLTPESVHKKLEELDLGCGVGSGKDTKDVFKNAGVSVISGTVVSDGRQNFKCHEEPPSRKKRAIDIMRNSSQKCCELGKKPEKMRRTCIRRLQEFEEEDSSCRVAFIECCVKAFGLKDMGFLARNAGGMDFMDLAGFGGPSDEELLDRNQVRSYFPETWIYEEKLIGDEDDDPVCQKYLSKPSCGRALLQATLPDTITTWVVQAVAISNQTGFGLAKPLHIKTYKEFFTRLTMPYSVQRGEQISVLVTVFNYQKQDCVVRIYLFGSDGFCSRATVRDKPKLMTGKDGLAIKAGGTVSFSMLIVPIKYGLVPIKIGAIVPGMNADIVKKNLLVVPEGLEKRKTQSYVLDPNGVLKDRKQIGEQEVKSEKLAFKSQRSFDRSKNKQTDNFVVDVPKESIPESVGAMLYFTGNLIGPVVTNLINGGLEGLLRMPTGCGEQTMLYLSPNVYVLQYLSNTNQVTASVEAKAYKFIQSGYQRELNYRRNDRSFSAFGERRQGSTWLTAFVTKVFCGASQFDGVEVDQNLICGSIEWLVQNQRADGAFPEVFAVIHKEMVGGVYQSDIAMTAFVLTSLLECRCNVSTAAITRATAFLEGNIAGIDKPYTLALTTYALAMANSAQRHQANQKLIELAVFNQATSSRHWNTGRHALNIETAAYALLAQVALQRLKYAGPIVVWLTGQKNSGGGFKSTTDTCVALQSLAKYSEQTVGSKLDLKITVESELGNLQKQFRINKQNALLQQAVDIFPYLGGAILVNSVGTGVAQMQVDVRYNVPSSRLERCNFKIQAKVSEDGADGRTLSELPLSDAPSKKKRKNRKKGGKNKRRKNRRKKNKKQKSPPASKLIIKVCTQYKKAGKTGMSIMDIGIFTGYEVDIASVKQLMIDMDDKIAKYEVSQRSIVFYLDEIDSADTLCVSFKVTRAFNVGMVYPVPIKVYDYYEPDNACTKFYSSEKGSLSMGSCDNSACKCTQDKCAASDPSIKNLDKLVQQACVKYDYAIKAKVLLVDEQNSWLTYNVKVNKVIKEGNTKLEKGKIIEMRKRGICNNPRLRKNDEVLIMGRDKSGQFILDNSAFIKNWEKSLKQFSRRILKGACG